MHSWLNGPGEAGFLSPPHLSDTVPPTGVGAVDIAFDAIGCRAESANFTNMLSPFSGDAFRTRMKKRSYAKEKQS